MDINDVRAAYTVIMFVVVLGIYFWAWSKKRKQDFNEAANLPFTEPDKPSSATRVSDNDNSGEKL